jgi:two-component system LytT family sensor kinase
MNSFFLSARNNNTRFLRHLIYWLGVLILFTVPASFHGTFEQVLIRNLLYLPLDILATYFVIYKLLPKYMGNKYSTFIVGLVFVYAIVICVSLMIRFFIEPGMWYQLDESPVSIQILTSVLIFSTIMAPALFIKYNSYYNQLNNKRLELERQNYQSQIKLLKSQIKPHFLFNTLNNIDELIYQSHQKASDAIVLLSENMRYMLNNSSLDKISLSKELKFINDYIELSRLSFPDKDFIEVIQKGHSGGMEIEPLLLLPLIENSIKHSNKKVPPPGITINVEIQASTIKLTTFNFLQTVRNNSSTKGFGLSNLKKRLELLYTNKFEFETEETSEFFKACLCIDLS